MYKYRFKRIMDVGIALTLMLVLSPILFLTALVLAVSIKENPLFMQNRTGKYCKIFKIVKLKTMNTKRDYEGNLLPDEKRLTRLGKLVRRTSIDEMPQLWNVLKGEMSLVGPRPLLPEFLPLYSEFQNKRHLVRPGITGWAQVNGRNDISWNQKFIFDVWYVENLSFILDVDILVRTVKKVVFSENINRRNFTTTEPFNGTN